MKYHFYSALLCILSLTLMGNQSCQSQKPASRTLRLDVEVGHIRTLPLKVENQEEILIDRLTHELFGRSIFTHNYFTVTNGSIMTFANKDHQLLSQYGFLDYEEVPHCQWESPQLQLNSDMLGFELVNRTGLGIGYSPSGTRLDQLRGKIKFVQFRMDYSILALQPLMQRMVAATDAVTYKSSVNLEFDFGQNSPITVDFFYQESMVKAIRDAMKKSLDQLIVRLKEQSPTSGKDWNNDIWESRVLFDPAMCDSDECVAIRGGRLNQIKVGDRFTVSNMIYTWDDKPCTSKLLRSVPEINNQNEIVIESVGDAVAIGRVQGSHNVAVEPGALVRTKLLVQ
jgi:hypothetical protein